MTNHKNPALKSSFCGEEGDTKVPRIAEEGSGGGGGPNIIWNLANCRPREIQKFLPIDERTPFYRRHSCP